MKNINRLRINNTRFSIRLVSVCENYNLTTVGQLSKMIERMNPNAKLSLPNGSYVRVTHIQRELDAFKS